MLSRGRDVNAATPRDYFRLRAASMSMPRAAPRRRHASPPVDDDGLDTPGGALPRERSRADDLISSRAGARSTRVARLFAFPHFAADYARFYFSQAVEYLAL